MGNGDGTFQAAVKYPAGISPYSVSVGDFNSDGILDLAVGNLLSNNVSVLLGNREGTFQAAVHYAVGSRISPPSSVAVRDFNSTAMAFAPASLRAGRHKCRLHRGSTRI